MERGEEQAMRPSKFTRICVFCGSSQGKKRSYQDAAIELGKELVRPFVLNDFIAFLFRGLFLVYPCHLYL